MPICIMEALKGFQIDKLYYISPNRHEIYENPGLRTNSGPDRDRQRVDARGRVLTVQQPNGAVAVFPSPHRFMWEPDRKHCWL